MNANIQRSLRKWLIGAGCTLSVALLFQYARTSDAYQAPASSETSGYVQNEMPMANDGGSSTSEDNRWRGRSGQDEGSNSFGSRSDSSSGDSFGFRSQTRAS